MFYDCAIFFLVVHIHTFTEKERERKSGRKRDTVLDISLNSAAMVDHAAIMSQQKMFLLHTLALPRVNNIYIYIYICAINVYNVMAMLR